MLAASLLGTMIPAQFTSLSQETCLKIPLSNLYLITVPISLLLPSSIINQHNPHWKLFQCPLCGLKQVIPTLNSALFFYSSILKKYLRSCTGPL